MSGRSQFEGFPKLITESDWIKLAAFIDGEGCIRIERQDPNIRCNKGAKSPRYGLIVHIANCDPRLSLWCQERFGGYIYLTEASRKNPKHRDAYSWHATSKRAEAVIRGCFPHFLLKREQAETALAFCSIAWTQLKGQTVPLELTNERERLKKHLETLKTQKFAVIDEFKKMA